MGERCQPTAQSSTAYALALFMVPLHMFLLVTHSTPRSVDFTCLPKPMPLVRALCTLLLVSAALSTPMAGFAQARPAPPRAGAAQPRYSPEAIRHDILDYLNNPTIRYRMIQMIEANYGMVGWRVVAEQLTGDIPQTRRTAAELIRCVEPAAAQKSPKSECFAASELTALRALMIPQLHRSLDMAGDHVSAWQALQALQATDSATFSRAIALRLDGTEMPIVHEMMGRADYARQLPELVAAFETCRKRADNFCEQQIADWIGHAGTAAAPFRGVFEAMLRDDLRSGRYAGPVSNVLATSGNLEAIRPLFENPKYKMFSPSGLGVAPPTAGVAFIVSLLETRGKNPNLNVSSLGVWLSCYGPVYAAPAEKVLIKLLNEPDFMRMEGVNVAMRIIRKQQAPSGECVRHDGAWRNP